MLENNPGLPSDGFNAPEYGMLQNIAPRPTNNAKIVDPRRSPTWTRSAPETAATVLNPSAQFPEKSYESIGAYFKDYVAVAQAAMRNVDQNQLARAAESIAVAIRSRATIYTCGNGGSAAIANHLLCDFLKGMQTNTSLLPKIVSLPANHELLLAIANDISYYDVFVYQLRTMASRGDVLLAISSSGNSENIVRSLQWARQNGLQTIVMTGFEGGSCKKLADISLHVPAKNYGVVEDCHHALMHMLAQYIRQRHMEPGMIPLAKF